MKNKKNNFKLLFTFLLLFSICITSFNINAAAYSQSPAYESVSEFVDKNTESINNNRSPINVVYFTISEDGNTNVISGDVSIHKLVEDVIIGSYNFYDDGSKNGKHYYEVQMKASTIDKSDYFTYSSLSVKPKNNTSYLSASTATYPSYLKKTSISDAKQYYYDGSGPSNPYVYVKSKYTVNGSTDYSIPENKLTKPIK